jgi:hypothetical protein
VRNNKPCIEIDKTNYLIQKEFEGKQVLKTTIMTALTILDTISNRHINASKIVSNEGM